MSSLLFILSYMIMSTICMKLQEVWVYVYNLDVDIHPFLWFVFFHIHQNIQIFETIFNGSSTDYEL